MSRSDRKQLIVLSLALSPSLSLSLSQPHRLSLSFYPILSLFLSQSLSTPSSLYISLSTSPSLPHLVVSSHRRVRQQGSVVDGIGGVVDQDGPVLDLQDLDPMSDHRGDAELTHLHTHTHTHQASRL